MGDVAATGGVSGITGAVTSSANMALSAINVKQQKKALEQQGLFRQQQAGFAADRLDFNSRFAELQAKDAISRGNKSSRNFLRKAKGLKGAQRAALAAQGIEVDTGSAAQVQEDTAKFSAIDANTIRNNAWREAFGFRIQAADFRGRASLTRIQGNIALANARFKGGKLLQAEGFRNISSGISHLNSLSSLSSGSSGGGSGGNSLVASSASGLASQGIQLPDTSWAF